METVLGSEKGNFSHGLDQCLGQKKEHHVQARYYFCTCEKEAPGPSTVLLCSTVRTH